MKKLLVNFKDEYLLWLIGFFPSMHVRVFFYRYLYGASLEKNVLVYKGCEIRSPKKLKIGRGSVIGDNAMLDARCGIIIGENVCFSSGVEIWTLQHDYRDFGFQCTPEHCGPVRIGDRVWIGPRVTILHSVNIGEGAVVGAGSVVTKDVAPYTVVAGVPAKEIAKRPSPMQYVFNGSHRHFI